MSFLSRSLCLFAVIGLALEARAQTTFPFTLDQPNCNFVFSGTAGAASIVGNPSNTFQLLGTQNLDLTFQPGAQPFATEAFSVGGVIATNGTLHGKAVVSIFTLATIDIANLTLEVSSAPVAVGAGGAFTTNITLTALSGLMTVTPTGGTASNTDLTGSSSNPTSVNGTLTRVGGNYHLVVPVNSTFAFTDPGSGISGSISLVGTITADHAFIRSFCVGDGTGTACPCGNNSPVGQGRGCVHSSGAGARLAASGIPSLSSDTLVLTGTSQPAGTLGLYFQGSALLGGGNGAAFGDGLLCLGSIFRMAIKAAPAGSSAFPIAGDPSISVAGAVPGAPTIRYYQLWYRDSVSFCTAQTYNLTNAMEVQWMP